MISLVLKPLKWIAIGWGILLAGQWVKWDGRTLGQHADRAQAQAFGWANRSLGQLAGQSVDRVYSATQSAPSRVERAKLRELIRNLD